MDQHLAAVRLLDEVIEHALGDLEVGNHAVLHGPDGDDVAGCAAHHLLGFLPDRLYFTRVLIDCNDGRFIDDNALSLRENQRVCRAEIYGKIGGDKAKNRPEIHERLF